MYNSDIPSRAALPTSRQLVRSTVVAAAVAAVLLITTVLPAEYGIDPTGIGRLTALTEMGEIKIQLQKEAEADRGIDPQDVAPAPPAADGRTSLPGAIVAQLFIRSAAAGETGPGERAGTGAPAVALETARAKVARRTDKISVTLKPGQGAEIKLRMKKGATVKYSWIVENGTVNFDAHGDGPGGAARSYKRGRSVGGDDGVLVAAFDGNHGWFWRNRTRKKVTVKLRTSGEYASVKRLM